MSNPIPSGGRLARRSHFAPRALRAAAFAVAGFVALAPSASALTVDFEDANLNVPPGQAYTGPGGGFYYNGSDGAGAWTSGGASFANLYDATYESWSGFAYANLTDATTPGYGNQYGAVAGGGFGGAGNYAVAYGASYGGTAPLVTFAAPVDVVSIRLTNTTYTALDLAAGSAFSKKFGGAGGSDPDWFKVVLTGRDTADLATGAVEFYLADFRFADNAFDYIVDSWIEVDLSGLGAGVNSIEFSFASSDTGLFGINTPTYVAIDQLVAVAAIPEPAALAGLAGGAALVWATTRRRLRVERTA